MEYQDIQALLDENKPGEALVLLDNVLAVEPDDPQALFLRGKAYWRLGDIGLCRGSRVGS